MRICRKCSKQVSGESRICRDCGAILDDVPEAEGLPPVAGFPLADEVGEERSLGEGAEESAQAAAAVGEEPMWNCPQCGELVAESFDVCWKCLTSRGGQKRTDDQAEFLRMLVGSSEDAAGEEPLALEAESLPARKEDVGAFQPACPRCGSTKMMIGVTVEDQGQHSGGVLKVVVCGDPSALFFKDPLSGELRANICGDCGHVELRVRNPVELYERYRKARQ